MKNILFDIETNGLLDELDVVHSLVILDIDTGEDGILRRPPRLHTNNRWLGITRQSRAPCRSQYTSIRLTSITKSVRLHLPR